MKCPNPYFTDIPTYGDMRIDHIILEDVYPILFVLSDKDGGRYIAVCCEIRQEQRWILNPISTVKLINLLEDNLLLREAFEIGEKPKVIAVRDYSTERDSFRLVCAQDIDPLDLPAIGEYLEAREENEEYTNALKDELLGGAIDYGLEPNIRLRGQSVAIEVREEKISRNQSIDSFELDCDQLYSSSYRYSRSEKHISVTAEKAAA